jgi:hypothetical protein
MLALPFNPYAGSLASWSHLGNPAANPVAGVSITDPSKAALMAKSDLICMAFSLKHVEFCADPPHSLCAQH